LPSSHHIDKTTRFSLQGYPDVPSKRIEKASVERLKSTDPETEIVTAEPYYTELIPVFRYLITR